jgi:uncharacterized protein YeaO (DUF488 family)
MENGRQLDRRLSQQVKQLVRPCPSAKWREFRVRYRKEVREKKDGPELPKQKSEDHTVILMYGARDERHSEASVLKRIPEGCRTKVEG